MMPSKVSIIIPTFNRAQLIGETLDSIQSQTYKNWECLVVDDGSTDNTAEVVQGYVEADDRFQFHHRPTDRPKGANACRNYGLELSKGDYINWFDSDDLMEPDKLKIQIGILEKEKTNWCICQTMWSDKETGKDLGLRAKSIHSSKPLEDYLCFKIFWSILAPLWRRTFIDHFNLTFDETLQQSQEYDFHIRALAIDDKYSMTERPLAKMFKHEGNLSNNWMDNDAKVKSNVNVKFMALKSCHEKLSIKGQLKVLEMVTITYKELLLAKKFKLARFVLKTIKNMLPFVQVSKRGKRLFLVKAKTIYWVYRIFGRGYSLLKPLHEA